MQDHVPAGEAGSAATDATRLTEEMEQAPPREVGPAALTGANETEPARTGFKVTDRRFWTMDQEELKREEGRPQLPTYVEQLRQQLEEKDRQLREYIAAYKKEVVEELEKSKQRLERDAAAGLERLRGETARPMMDVLDVLERSLGAAQTSRDVDSLVRGLGMVHLLMVQKLQELGLSRMDTVGKRFDPAVHEAAAVVAVGDAAQDGVIQGELKPGFTLGERVVRPALVQVGRFAAGAT